MSSALSEVISDLQMAARSDAPGSAERIDGAVARIYELHDPAAIEPMLLVLDDDYTFQELMWSIVHLAESYDAPDYVVALVAVLPKLSSTAPGWASTLVRRILRGGEGRDLALFAQEIGRADPNREAVRAVLAQVTDDGPDELREQAQMVLAKAR